MALVNGKTQIDEYDYDSALRDRSSSIEDIGTSQSNYVQEAASRRLALKQQADDEAFAKAHQAQTIDTSSFNKPQPSSSGQTTLSPTSSTYSGPKGSFGAFMNSIATQESGGNYGAPNSSSGAMGKYQIMPANLGGQGNGWDREALGYDISPTQFMASPQLQEKIASFKLKGYYDKYGPAGAAIAWYAGPGAAAKYSNIGSYKGGAKASNIGPYTGGAKGYTNLQGAYPSISSYERSILKRMGL